MLFVTLAKARRGATEEDARKFFLFPPSNIKIRSILSMHACGMHSGTIRHSNDL